MYTLVAEHSDFLVVNKSTGVLVHGGGGDALVDQLRIDFGSEVSPCHRLDKETSGLVLFAKNTAANSQLSQAFGERRVAKTYIAISDKRPRKKQGRVTGGMEKARNGSWKLTRGRDNSAETYFDSAGLGDGGRFFLLHPITGKTHQIRVAMKSLGAPILGDARYGGKAADRMYLHALSLAFEWSGQRFAYTAMPAYGAGFLGGAVSSALQRLQAKSTWGDRQGSIGE